MKHQCAAHREDVGYVVSCSCGWTQRYISRTAAYREAKVHRKHGVDSNELARQRLSTKEG